MTIKVTQEHIDHGSKKDPYNCPVALAIHSETGRVATVRCMDMWVGLEYFGRLPELVEVFVHAFDSGLPVSPFEFDLPL